MAYKPTTNGSLFDDDFRLATSEAVVEGLKLKQDALPLQTSNADKVLVTDGSALSWQFAGLGAGSLGTGNVILGRAKPAGLTGTNNFIFGSSAGTALTTGGSNHFIGVSAGRDTSTGNNNIAIGNGALRTSQVNSNSIAIGNAALLNFRDDLNTWKTHLAIGVGALESQTTGFDNVAVGYYALRNGTTQQQTVAVGRSAGERATANNQVFIGHVAGQGAAAGASGASNTAVGWLSLNEFTTGAANCLLGYSTGRYITTGQQNNFFGYVAGQGNTTDKVTGSFNQAFGSAALTAITSGSTNIAIGHSAGDAITTGSNNVIIGDIAGSTTLSNTMIFAAGTAERFRVDSSGNMGIGTSSPGAKLDVRGSAVFNEDGADADFRVEGDTDANLLFVDASTDRVGIGTATPAEKLEVNGAILATEYRVTNYRLDPHVHNDGTKAANFTINWSTGAVQRVVLDAAGPLVIAMSNPVDGGAYALRITQGATPGTVTWPAEVKWPGGTPPTLSNVTGKIDVINLLYFSDTGHYYATHALDFA